MKTLNHHSGFTLIEVIIAIVLLTVALFSLAGETSVIIGGNSFSKMQTTATALACDQMELLKSTSFAAIASSAGYPAWLTCSTPNSNFKKRWQVTANSDTTLKTLALDVKWGEHSVSLTTTIAK